MASTVMPGWQAGDGCSVRNADAGSSILALTDLAVISGVISLPIATLAYFCLPDNPRIAKPNWLFTARVSSHFVQRRSATANADGIQDLEIAKKRLEQAGRAPEGKPYTVKVILGYFLSWKTVLFTLIFSKHIET
jgi:MFS transporter, ACS family, pantothenate transporter